MPTHLKRAMPQRVKLQPNVQRRLIWRYILAALLTLSAVPVSHAAVCSLDIDGNGRLEATTDGC